MRSLQPREKRTVRLAVVILGIYLLGFYGLRLWRHIEAKRVEFGELRFKLSQLEREVRQEEEKRRSVERLKKSLALDLEKLSEDTVVAETLAAIQEAARTHTVNLGTSKEAQENPSSRELAIFQLEGNGSLDGVSKFLHTLGHLGYPLIIDHLTLKPMGKEPGHVRLTLRVALVNFKGWKNQGDGRA